MQELVESLNHHLRTSLTTMLGHADLLLAHRHELPVQMQDSLADIVRAGSQLDDVVTSTCELIDVAFGCPDAVEQTDISELVEQEVARDRVCCDTRHRAVPHGRTRGRVHRKRCEPAARGPGLA